LKHNKISRKWSHIFLLWLLSYICILIVPITISVLLYMASDKVIEEEISKANATSMRQLQQIIDDKLTDIRKISIDVGWDDQVVKFMRAKTPLDSSYQHTMVDIIKRLKAQSSANKLIDFLYIYFKNSSTVLSISAANDEQQIYDFYHKSDSFQYEDWKRIIGGVHTWDYEIIPRIISPGNVSRSISFLQTIPIEYPSVPLGNVVIMIDEDQFAGILSEVKWVEESTIFIIDKKNNIIASTGSINLPETLNYERLINNQGYINEKINSEAVIMTYIDSGVSDWKYISVIPKAVFLKKAKYVRDLTMAGILFCLIIGGTAAYILAKKNYSPIKKILETLSKRAGISFNRDINEFDFINNSIELTVEQKDNISNKLKNQYSLIKTNYLVKLLKGNIENNVTIKEALTSYDIEFCSEHFAVMMFLLEDIGRFCEKTGEKSPENGIHLARFIIQNIVHELAEENNKSFVVEIDEVVVCVVNFKSTDRFYGEEELIKITMRIRDILENEFKIFFTGAISSVHETPFGISQAYQEALEALEYKLVVGAGKVISYKDIKKSEAMSNSYEFTLEMQQKFINCIKAEDFNGAEKIMEDVINSTFSQASIPIAMAKCLMFAMVNTMINALKELSIVCDTGFLERLNPVERLLSCKTVMDVKYEMKSILRNVGEYIADSREEKNNTLAQRVKTFVEENYKDSNLNLAIISDSLEMNPAYLSRQFKHQTGEGLLDYINLLRIEKAKQLLGKTGINVNEIAEIVGYYNSNAFIRAFKKYEGITPGKYRELI
jgi:AraC-like DNA-binding protein